MLSPRRPALALSVAALLAAGGVRPLRGQQATGTLDPVEESYRYVDALVAEGLVDRVVVGQRPYSRREVARIAAEARRNLPRLTARRGEAAVPDADGAAVDERVARVEEMLRRIDADLGVDSTGAAAARAADRARSWWSVADAPARPIPSADGVDHVDALVGPLTTGAGGRQLADGATLELETSHHATLGRHLAAVAEPRLRAVAPRGGTAGAGVTFQRLYAELGAGNLRLDVGREYLLWGQGMDGGLAASLTGPALGMVRVSGDAPFRLPWLLRRLGWAQGTLFLADLGASQNFPHARLVGYKASLAPAPWLELGVTVLDQTGGSGAPRATFIDRVADAIPIIDAIQTSGDYQFSNKLSGADLRLRVPRARGLELWAEGLLDDFDIRRVRSSLWEDDGVQLGARLPRVTADGRLQLAAEFHHTGLRYYEHTQFTSGVTYAGRLIGDPLGPRGDAVYLQLRHEPLRASALPLVLAHEIRSDDHYRVVVSDASAAGWRFVKVEDRPEEVRDRALVTWERWLRGRQLRVSAVGGWERTRQLAFQPGRRAHGLLARVGAEWRP